MKEYIRYTRNPKNETNDCIIRSIANAEDRDWVDVMRDMCDLAISMYNMPNAYEVNQAYMEKKGYPEEYTFASDNITVETFCEQHPEGRWVVLLEDHALSVINGDFYDLTNSLNEKVVSYWCVKENS